METKTFADVMNLVEEVLVLRDFATKLEDIGKRNIELLQSYITIFTNLKPTNLENIKVLHKTLQSCLSFIGNGESINQYFTNLKMYRNELANLERIADSPLAEMLYNQLITELLPLLQKELDKRMKNLGDQK